MKKLTFLIAVLLMIAGCGTGSENLDPNQGDTSKYEVKKIIDEVTSEDFIYRLVSEQSVYRKGESVNLYGELEYIGESDAVTIFHAASPFHFPIVETTRNYEIDYPMAQPLISATLKKNEPLREYYQSSGSFSELDSEDYRNFMQKLMEEGFPIGEYVVNGYADFFVEEPIKESYQLKGQIEFKVE